MSAFESSLQASVVKWLKEHGHVCYNIHGNEFQAGIPDLLCGIYGRFVAFELKAADGQLSGLQKSRIRDIRRRGNIAEPIQTLERVKEIVECISQGKTWEATPL